MSDDFKAGVEKQIAEEILERPTPTMDFDRLRSGGPAMLHTLKEKLAKGQTLKTEKVKRYVHQFKVIVELVEDAQKQVEKRQLEWLQAGEGAQVWSAAAMQAAGELYDGGIPLRNEVNRRLPDSGEGNQTVRRKCGVGNDALRSSPLNVLDLGRMQVAALQEEEVVAALDARGIDAEPYLERLKPLLATLEDEVKRGTGPKKGEARARRDEAQRRLEILLARAVSKISSVLGPAEANAFDAILPRQHARRSTDTKPTGTPGQPATLVTNGMPDAGAVTVSTASVPVAPGPASTGSNPGPQPAPDKPQPK